MLKLQSSVALNDVNHRQLPQIVTNLPKRLPAQVFAAELFARPTGSKHGGCSCPCAGR